MGAVTSTLERMVIDVAWTCHEWFYGSATGTGTCINPRFLAARRKTHAARRALSDCRLHSHLAPRHRDDLDDEGVTSLQVARHRHQKFCDHDDGRVTSLPATRHRHQKLCDHDDERVTSHRHQQPRDQDEDVRMLLALPAVLPAASRVSTDDAADSDSDDWLPRHLRDPPSCTSTPAPQRRPRRRATLCLPGEGHRPAVSCRQGDPEPQRPLRRSQRSVPHSTLQAMLFRCTAARNGCLSSKTTLPDVYPVRRMGRSWSVHNATANRAATL